MSRRGIVKDVRLVGLEHSPLKILKAAHVSAPNVRLRYVVATLRYADAHAAYRQLDVFEADINESDPVA